MRHLLYATEPEPTWFGRFDSWRVHSGIVQTPDDLAELRTLTMPSPAPQVAYLWTSDGRLTTDDVRVLVRSLHEVAPVMIWAFPPVAPKIAEIVAVRKVFGDHEPLRESPRKIEQPVRALEGDVRYWGAILIGDAELDAAVAFLTKRDSLLLTHRDEAWSMTAQRIAADLQLGSLGRLWNVQKSRLLRLVADLTSRGEMIVWFYHHVSDQVRMVAVIHGHPETVQQFEAAVRRNGPVEVADVKDLGRDE